MPYNTKTTITFSFDLPINLDSKAQAESRIKDLISSGNISLKLPNGFKNLELEDCKISVTGFNSDSRNSNSLDEFNIDSDDHDRTLEAAQQARIDRMVNKHKNSR